VIHSRRRRTQSTVSLDGSFLSRPRMPPMRTAYSIHKNTKQP
jgi:hypothetical protein